MADPAQRQALMAQTVKQDWNVDALETRVRSLHASIDLVAGEAEVNPAAPKRFTELLLVDAVEVIIATSKVDKYDRYLADVPVLRPSGEEIFLNNALLENGHAVLLGHEEMTDWTP